MSAMPKRGITLLLAVLILSSVLSISLGIFYIILVELQINQNARESYKAYYSALTGMECARLYHWRASPDHDPYISFWDPAAPCFGTPDGSACATPQIPFCAGRNVTYVSDSPKTSACYSVDASVPPKKDCVGYDYIFDINDTPSDRPGIYAHVTVHAERFDVADETNSTMMILITSVGKNDASMRAVNRSIEYCSAGNAAYCPKSQQP